MESSFISSLLIASSVGFASGAIGAFIILRRMALVGDALSHVALPGIALALLYGIDPLWGVWAFLIGAAAIVWWLEIKTTLPAEALVGLLFTASLAVGILLIPNAEIVESLFGEFPQLSLSGLSLFLAAAFLLALLSFLFARAFLLSLVSRDLARVGGLGVRYDLLLFLIFASVVALGIKLVGTLLMGALTIIPASIAKNISRSISGYIILSAFLGSTISVAGIFTAKAFSFLPGPAIILSGTALFLLSLLFKR